jgi:dephospho-CoA kinase
MIIGVTGGFGSGKTFVAGIFNRLGVKVIDADKLAHKAIEKGSAAYKKAVSKFGVTILRKDGSIDRRALAGLVFADKKRLAALNRIVHPFVLGRIKSAIKEYRADVLVIDAPLICETSLIDSVDILVVVKAPRKEQVARCVKKFRLKEADVCKRMACQMPLKAKVAKADYVIDNGGTRKETEKQVMNIWQEIKKGARLWR